jgi:hypothetical protein
MRSIPIIPNPLLHLFRSFGFNPADGLYQTHPRVHKFLTFNGTNYFLEMGGIGLANYIYDN